MEEKKAEAQSGTQKKLTYEELSQYAAELSQQNQQLVQRLRQAHEALDDRDFNYTSFYLSMLFKVLDHPEAYNDTFVVWASGEIEDALTTFGKTAKGEMPEPEKK